ncbi:MAG: hypothetical protein VXZ63_07035 [Planctomycetota bacterium]|nr:hypothetical protein [Planctomycetota bacterium]
MATNIPVGWETAFLPRFTIEKLAVMKGSHTCGDSVMRGELDPMDWV